MIIRILKLALFLVCLSFATSSQTTQMPTSERIIRAERPHILDDSDSEQPFLQIVSVTIGGDNVGLNKIFSANDNWLTDLKIHVKNISRETITCVQISFGLVAQIDTKLQSAESWPWGLVLNRGNCERRNRKNKLRLEPGDVIILDRADMPLSYLNAMDKMGPLKKAVLRRKAGVRIGKAELIELPLGFSPETIFLNDKPF